MSDNFFKHNDGNYVETMLSLYIWKSFTPPEADQIVNYKFPENMPKVEINVQDYMDKVGNNIPLSQQRLFKVFFNLTTKDNFQNGITNTITLEDIKEKSQSTNQINNEEIILTHKEFMQLAYNKKTDDPIEPIQISVSQYTTDTSNIDYWKKALVFGSTYFDLDLNSIRYVYSAKTGMPLRVENVLVSPQKDNYDLFSSNSLAAIVNSILYRLTDPFSLGETVDIYFTSEINESKYVPYNYSHNINDSKKLGIFTAQDYWKDVLNNSNLVGFVAPIEPSSPSADYASLYLGLKKMQELKSIKYKDQNGKLVIFGTKNSDIINTVSVKDLELDNLVDGKLKNEVLDAVLKKILPFLKEYINSEHSDTEGNIMSYAISSAITGIIYTIKKFNVTFTPVVSAGISLLADLLIEEMINKFKDGIENGVIYVGREGDDSIIGTKKSDHLLGGKGIDTLNGNGGKDVLEGGEGEDIYHIHLGDTIKDENGTIVLGNGQILSSFFKKISENAWRTENHSHRAIRNSNDLLVFSDKTKENFIISDFFLNAKNLSAFGITLAHNYDHLDYDKEPPKKFIAEKGMNASFISAAQDVHYIGSDKTDRVTSNMNQGMKADLGDGSDFFGGNNKSDIANGGNGTDILIGSRNNPKTHKDDDNDRFEGGNGRDLIDAGSGDDVAYGGNANKSPDGLKEDESGDWIVLGKGNDYSIGGDGKDIMMGGEGQDTIMGGKGRDLILGDGDIKFNYLTETINTYNFSPIDTRKLFDQTATQEDLKDPNKITTNDYQYSNLTKTWQKSDNAHFVFVIDKENFNWELKFVEEGKDYEIEAPIKIKDSDNNHLFSPYGDPNNPELAILHNDFLYGDEGHDLIMGQIGHDYIHAGDGDDIVYGDDKRNPNIKGNDVMNGGKGYNRLFGGDGDDTYIVTREDMKFMTYNIIDDSEGFDTLDLSDFNIQEVFIDLNTPNDLFLSSSMGSLMAHIKNWSESNKSIEEFRFADGIVTADDITSRLQPYEYPILIHEPPIDDEC